MAILATLMAPAFNVFNGAGSFTKAVSDISSTLQQARAYAMAKNTYVYLGLQEVDALQATAANGVGRLVTAAVASRDGTRPTNFSSAGVVAISKAQFFNGSHIANSGSLSSSGGMQRTNATVDMGATDATTTFNWPIGGPAQYSFVKVIEFDPQGVARVQTSAGSASLVVPYIEIALVPARGNTVSPTNANQAAIQINGITGVSRIFRP